MPALGLMSASQTGTRTSAADPVHLIALDVPTGSGDTFVSRTHCRRLFVAECDGSWDAPLRRACRAVDIVLVQERVWMV
jgi:hypothetical protein